MEKLSEFKEEMRKLRNERKVFEKYHKAVRSLPNEERQEIEPLKNQKWILRGEEIKRSKMEFRYKPFKATNPRFRRWEQTVKRSSFYWK